MHFLNSFMGPFISALIISTLPLSSRGSNYFRRFLLQNSSCQTNILHTYKSDIVIRASSELYHDDPKHDFSASRGVLETTEITSPDGAVHMGGWAANFNNFLQYIEIEMTRNFTLTGIITQGRSGCCEEWVTSYRVMTSQDCTKYHVVDGANGAIFPGNTDENTKVRNDLPRPVTAKCLRINPIAFHNHITMRVGLIGHLVQDNSICSRLTSIVPAQVIATTYRPIESTSWIHIPG